MKDVYVWALLADIELSLNVFSSTVKLYCIGTGASFVLRDNTFGYDRLGANLVFSANPVWAIETDSASNVDTSLTILRNRVGWF